MEPKRPRLINDFVATPRPSAPMPHKKSRYDNYPLSLKPKKVEPARPAIQASTHTGTQINHPGVRPRLMQDMAPAPMHTVPKHPLPHTLRPVTPPTHTTVSQPPQPVFRPKTPAPALAHTPTATPASAYTAPTEPKTSKTPWWRIVQKNDAYVFAGTLVIALAVGIFVPVSMFSQTVCLCYGAIALIVGVDSKYSFGTALSLLIATMLSQALQFEEASSSLAVAAFLFLCAGTLSLLRDAILPKKRDFKNNNKNNTN